MAALLVLSEAVPEDEKASTYVSVRSKVLKAAAVLLRKLGAKRYHLLFGHEIPAVQLGRALQPRCSVMVSLCLGLRYQLKNSI